MKIKLLSILILILFAGCSGDEEKVADDNSYYTCPMHPSVRSETPGACPICGMDLVKKELAEASEHADMVHLTLRQEKKAGILTDSLKYGWGSVSTSFPGRVVSDPNAKHAITARISGRINKLYIKEPLSRISKGSPVFEIYSEALNSDLQEYRVLVNSKEKDELTSQLITAAKNKLILWGLTENEINQAVRSNSTYTSTFYSDYNGTVTLIGVSEGGFVQKGQTVLEVEGLENVWVEITGYPGDRISGSARVMNRSGVSAEGEIVLSSPETDRQSTRAYVAITNRNMDFVPGQEVMVELSGQRKRTYLLPRPAVLPGEMETVWLKTGKGMYEPRMVITGNLRADSIEIISGLDSGDRVVVQGAYLLNSEFILQRGAGAAHSH